jgi:PKD repeat protein
MAVRLPLLKIGEGMDVDFVASKLDPEIGEAITFTGITTPTASEFAWDFGDNTFSRLQNPTKTYVLPGDYTVKLLAANNSIGGIETKVDYINVQSAPIVTDGLIYYIDATDTNSYPGTGNDWFDISGQDRTTELLNGTSYSTDGGGSMVFDGIDDIARVKTAFNPNISTKTLLAWVKLNNVSQTGSGVIGIGYNDVFDTITYNETNAGWGFGSNNFARTFWTGVKETTPQWVMITAIYDSGIDGYKMYRNNQLIGQGTQNLLTYNFSNIKYFLGVRGFVDNPLAGWLNGNISVAMVYNKALSPAEVEINFNGFKGRYGY